jgi:hypothetical protein
MESLEDLSFPVKGSPFSNSSVLLRAFDSSRVYLDLTGCITIIGIYSGFRFVGDIQPTLSARSSTSRSLTVKRWELTSNGIIIRVLIRQTRIGLGPVSSSISH